MTHRSADLPFTVLTGFLGAGKTTALNRLLATEQHRRVAVLVNELGRVSIDTQLITNRGGDILELAGGCICCKVDGTGDLWGSIFEVIERSKPDHVVLETTGIAEPPAIVEGLATLREGDHEGRPRVHGAGVICVVDAAAGPSLIDRRDEARIQIESADRILLSKLDLASAGIVAQVHDKLDTINPAAERAAFPQTPSGSRELSAWILASRTLHPSKAHQHRHSGAQVVAVCFEDDVPLLEAPLLAVIAGLGERLLRVKGFVNLVGHGRPAYVELAGGRVTVRRNGGSDHADPGKTQLVLIGEDLDELAIRRQLWACHSGGGPG